MKNKTNKKDAFIRDVTSLEPLSKSEVRIRLDEIIEDKIEEIVNDTEKLKTTRPEYESDAYDNGLKDMKNTILQLIR